MPQEAELDLPQSGRDSPPAPPPPPRLSLARRGGGRGKPERRTTEAPQWPGGEWVRVRRPRGEAGGALAHRARGPLLSGLAGLKARAGGRPRKGPRYVSVPRAPPARVLGPPPAAEPAAAPSGRYLSQQMSQVMTTEKRARMLATDRQMGPTGEGAPPP